MIRGIYRMTAGQFRKAIEAGVFGQRHVELLGGIPFVMSENPPHILISSRLFAALSAVAMAPRWVMNKQHRLELGNGYRCLTPSCSAARTPPMVRDGRVPTMSPCWSRSPTHRTPGTAE
jgi:hypothetical protein